VVIVRGPVDHDSRVLRVARALRGLGFDATVLGVVSFGQRSQVNEREGVPVRRLGPSSRLAWAIYRQISFLSPTRRPGADPGLGGRPPAAGRMPARAARRAASLGRRALRWGATLAYYRSAIAAVRQIRPALVHCCDYNTMWVGAAARLLCGSAVVYDSHELWPDRNQRVEPRAWLMAGEWLLTRVAHRVTTTSPAHAEVMARRYRIPSPVTVRNIPEGTGPDRRPLGTTAAGASGDGRRARRPDPSPLVVYVGGLQPNRGLEQAIEAVARIDGARLRLLGPGAPTYRSELEQLARAERVDDRVEFSPPVAPAEVVPAVRDADLGLALFQPTCLSHRLVLPNKLFEYTLAGLPVLGSDLPMISAFISEHRLGATVDPGDAEAIAAKIRELIEPEANARLRAAAERAAATIDWERERELLEDVYADALAASGYPGRGRAAAE
jgi:glycosyltransferase involved in cell wall biosynthesis